MEENSYMSSSRLRPPSRIASPGKGLIEISEAQGNARSIPPSKMLPPGTLKREMSASSDERDPKRKTLAARAEHQSASNIPNIPRSGVKGTSIVSAAKLGSTNLNGSTRYDNFSSSISRATSTSFRTTSNSSFASSVGPGVRPKSSYGRPQTSMAFSQSTATRPRATSKRPTTSMENHPSDVAGTRNAFETEQRLEQMEKMFFQFKDSVDSTSKERTAIENAMNVYKTRIAELESIRMQLSSSNTCLQTDLDDARQKMSQMSRTVQEANALIDEQSRSNRLELEDVRRDCRNQIDQLRREHNETLSSINRHHHDELRDRERGSINELEERIREIERRNDARLEDERNRRLREVEDLQRQIILEQQNLSVALQKKDLEIENMRGQLEELKGELDREQTLKGHAQKELGELRETLQKTGATTSSTIQSLEATVASLRARIHYLESDSKAQSDSYAEMESRMQEAVRSAEMSKQKLVKEETLRRILFNQVQELKGNIRVMCRVRPVFANGSEGDPAKLKFPDTDKEGKELEILGKEEKSSLGNVTRKAHSFTFDRVFGPESQNQEVFEEISQLVQSALDGYNVCIFCYGQTGSGKTHTMSSADGMIPRATQQIYETATNLREKGWEYVMEGSFVEVYNEEIHDLLCSSTDKKKHEIRHDEQKKQTTVTGLRTVTLDSPNTVKSILKQAAANRSVAATKSNERSSRSHSVFILKLVGRNTTTGETSEGTLNLVDLAGSERLKQSGAEGDRMKETQNINKSLSCLGDVIGALGQGKEGAHIPYRNSKLTYLLQYSLGGNSKTLMFTMISPMEGNLSETLTSLKFATKVHNTHIGTAKKNSKVRERGNDG